MHPAAKVAVALREEIGTIAGGTTAKKIIVRGCAVQLDRAEARLPYALQRVLDETGVKGRSTFRAERRYQARFGEARPRRFCEHEHASAVTCARHTAKQARSGPPRDCMRAAGAT